MVKPWLFRRILSGGIGFGSLSESRMPASSSLACWLGIVRDSTTSSRSRQNAPVILTSEKANGEKKRCRMLVSQSIPVACAAGLSDDQRTRQPAGLGDHAAGHHVEQTRSGLAPKR